MAPKRKIIKASAPNTRKAAKANMSTLPATTKGDVDSDTNKVTDGKTEAADQKILNDNDNKPIQDGDDVVAEDFVLDDADGKFILFKKLPIEVRLKIWGSALPTEGVFIIQAECSEESESRFTYSRKVPALLQVCQESRREFLDTGLEEHQDFVNARRKKHPMYRLCFIPGRTRGVRVYFSFDIDTFCGFPYPGRRILPNNASKTERELGGISELDVAPYLQSLCIMNHMPADEEYEPGFFRKNFPNLKNLRFLEMGWVIYEEVETPDLVRQTGQSLLDAYGRLSRKAKASPAYQDILTQFSQLPLMLTQPPVYLSPDDNLKAWNEIFCDLTAAMFTFEQLDFPEWKAPVVTFLDGEEVLGDVDLWPDEIKVE